MADFQKYDLTESTFIIPLRIESNDRAINTCITLRYLCKYFNTNIIILEHDYQQKVPNILKFYGLEIYVKYIFKQRDTEIFHRTKFLNEMLEFVTTRVVINYDIDVLLHPLVYVNAQEKILNGYDLVYPYFFGRSQYKILPDGRDLLVKSLELNDQLTKLCISAQSEYGHCQFFLTDSYKKGGMENEAFISYGPEDKERGYRFQKLGFNVIWLDNYIYHIEHTRGVNSSYSNPYNEHNNNLFQKIKNMSIDQLRAYYNICLR